MYGFKYPNDLDSRLDYKDMTIFNWNYIVRFVDYVENIFYS